MWNLFNWGQIDQTDETNEIDEIHLSRMLHEIDETDETDEIDYMTKLTRFEDLECWQEARKLTQLVYKATNRDRFKKDLRLCSQIQSAAGSSMANIAEGFIRRSDKEFIQFLFIAMASTAEVQSHLYIALDQGYIDRKDFDEIYNQANKTGMIISGLIRYLRTKKTKSTK